jgi:prophage regulatory protein
MQTATYSPKRLINIVEVMVKTDMGKTSIYNEIREGKFPRPVKRGIKSSWVEGEIDTYIENLVKARDGSSNQALDDEL